MKKSEIKEIIFEILGGIENEPSPPNEPKYIRGYNDWEAGYADGLVDGADKKPKITDFENETEKYKRGYDEGYENGKKIASKIHKKSDRQLPLPFTDPTTPPDQLSFPNENLEKEGYGMGDPSKDKKAKGRWTVKYDSDSKILKEIWRPEPLRKDKQFVVNLIFSLKDGEGIWFSYDNISGHQGTPEYIQKRVEGDEFVYLVGTGEHKSYLETDDEIEHWAAEIADNRHLNYYNISKIKGYTKKPYEGDPDHDIGHYELYGADPIEPQYESGVMKEVKRIKKSQFVSLFKESLKEVVEEVVDYTNNDTNLIKAIQRRDAEAIFYYRGEEYKGSKKDFEEFKKSPEYAAWKLANLYKVNDVRKNLTRGR